VLRRSLVAALLVAVAGCGGSDGPDPNATLVDAHAALCEAAAEPARARALFFDRAHDALHEVARRVEESERPLAAQLLEAKEVVESDLTATRQARPDDLRRLAEVYRTTLGRLAITVAPCD
jgi:hypothetical protein